MGPRSVERRRRLHASAVDGLHRRAPQGLSGQGDSRTVPRNVVALRFRRPSRRSSEPQQRDEHGVHGRHGGTGRLPSIGCSTRQRLIGEFLRALMSQRRDGTGQGQKHEGGEVECHGESFKVGGRTAGTHQEAHRRTTSHRRPSWRASRVGIGEIYPICSAVGARPRAHRPSGDGNPRCSCLGPRELLGRLGLRQPGRVTPRRRAAVNGSGHACCALS